MKRDSLIDELQKPQNCRHLSIVARLTNPPVYECSHCGARFRFQRQLRTRHPDAVVRTWY